MTTPIRWYCCSVFGLLKVRRIGRQVYNAGDGVIRHQFLILEVFDPSPDRLSATVGEKYWLYTDLIAKTPEEAAKLGRADVWRELREEVEYHERRMKEIDEALALQKSTT